MSILNYLPANNGTSSESSAPPANASSLIDVPALRTITGRVTSIEVAPAGARVWIAPVGSATSAIVEVDHQSV